MGRNGNAPEGLSKVNRTGVPWVSLVLAFLVGCFFFLPFPGWSKLVEFVTNSTVLSFGCGPIVLLAMRKQMPEHERPFRLGDKGVWVIGFLALWSTNLIVYWTGWDTNWKLFVAIILGYGLMAVYHKVAKRPTPPLDFKYGWWLLVWYAGLALISYLGDYPEQEAKAGQPRPPRLQPRRRGHARTHRARPLARAAQRAADRAGAGDPGGSGRTSLSGTIRGTGRAPASVGRGPAPSCEAPSSLDAWSI